VRKSVKRGHQAHQRRTARFLDGSAAHVNANDL
jgi:hypothetical protein